MPRSAAMHGESKWANPNSLPCIIQHFRYDRGDREKLSVGVGALSMRSSGVVVAVAVGEHAVEDK